jgi:hypothetical protein
MEPALKPHHFAPESRRKKTKTKKHAALQHFFYNFLHVFSGHQFSGEGTARSRIILEKTKR